MSRSIRLKGRARVRGVVTVPGDKSISHRVAMLASAAEGPSVIRGFASSADCAATLDCIERLGVRVERGQDRLIVHGVGARGYDPPQRPAALYAANSGSTMRMLAGFLAAQEFTSILDGDRSLRARPMARIIEPLSLMGAKIDAREGNLAPLEITGGHLKAIDYASRVASAQVKSCVLFAGLFAQGQTAFTEPAQTRNHSELMLEEFGARIAFDPGNNKTGNRVVIEGGAALKPLDYQVSGDPSSAAFFAVAATILPDSSVTIPRVNLNPTRTAFIDALNGLGASISARNVSRLHGELTGDLEVTSSALKSAEPATVLAGQVIANLIDELPILAVAATQVEGRLIVRDAKELRVKESDRLRTIVGGLRALGAEVEEYEDGFAVSGPQRLRGGRVETAGDHRIAMAFSVAALAAEGATEIVDADCARVSFPEFYDLLGRAAGEEIFQA